MRFNKGKGFVQGHNLKHIDMDYWFIVFAGLNTSLSQILSFARFEAWFQPQGGALLILFGIPHQFDSLQVSDLFTGNSDVGSFHHPALFLGKFGPLCRALASS